MTIKESRTDCCINDCRENSSNNHHTETPIYNTCLRKIEALAVKKRIEQLNHLKRINRMYLSKHSDQPTLVLLKPKVIKMKLILPEIPFSRHYIHTDKTIKLCRKTFQDIKYLHKENIFTSPPLQNQLEVNKLMCLIVCSTLNQEMLFKLFLDYKQKHWDIRIPDPLKYLSEKIDVPPDWILGIWHQNSIYVNFKEEKTLEQLNYDLCDVCWLFNCAEHIKFSRYLKFPQSHENKIHDNNVVQNEPVNLKTAIILRPKEKSLLKQLIPLFSSPDLIVKLLNLKTGKNFSNEFITKKISSSETKLFPSVLTKEIFPLKLYTDNDPTKSPLPCLHKGICLNNPLCSCYLNSVYCNQRCGCLECNIEFPTCLCENCNINCLCKKNSISCFNCGCGTCYNKNFVERDLQIKISEIEGLGLFSNEVIEKGEFIIEYTGEIIDFHTTEFRGRVYEEYKCSYIFDLPYTFYEHDTSIDAMNLGNKSRFINHSDAPNIQARTIKDNTKHRIMFFALEDIEKGEELLFTYNYEDNLKDKFGL